MACPGCRQSIWYSTPNQYLRKMVKTLKVECPRYHCNSSVQMGDLITHLNSCVNSTPPSMDELGGYLKDFPDPHEFVKTFKFCKRCLDTAYFQRYISQIKSQT